MQNITLDVRVYPIDEPTGSTVAFASVAVEPLAAIRGIRVVDSETKGLFVSMPQSQSNSGLYHDVAFPKDIDLRNDMLTAIMDEYNRQVSLSPKQRGYEKPENSVVGGINAGDVEIDARVFPVNNAKGDTLAFASVAIDDLLVIRGIRVVNSEKGQFVSMPQSKYKNEVQHEVAFPLSGDLRKAVSNAVLGEYRQRAAEREQSLGGKLAKGKAKAAQQTAAPRTTVKSHNAEIG